MKGKVRRIYFTDLWFPSALVSICLEISIFQKNVLQDQVPICLNVKSLFFRKMSSTEDGSSDESAVSISILGSPVTSYTSREDGSSDESAMSISIFGSQTPYCIQLQLQGQLFLKYKAVDLSFSYSTAR